MFDMLLFINLIKHITESTRVVKSFVLYEVLNIKYLVTIKRRYYEIELT